MECKPIPAKIEARLMELLQMEEFDMQEVKCCRATYWSDRDGWHMILVNCYESAKARIAALNALAVDQRRQTA